MRTLTAQAAMSVCVLLFALLALQIARRVPADQPAFRYAWALTGASFLARGLNSLFHDVFATTGYLSGPDSRAWAAVLVWHPILNDSRTFLLIAYCIVFLVALLRAGRNAPLPPLRSAMAIILAGMLLGAVVGWQEAAFSGETHYTMVAVLDIAAMFAMFAILFVGLSTATLDRNLWACLGIYTFILALSALSFAFLSRVDVVGEWAPRASTLQSIKALLYVGLDAVAFRAWIKVRNGKRLRPFIEDRPFRPAVPSLNL